MAAEEREEREREREDRDMNRDPVTGEPGAHPVGTGVGAAAGAVAGGAAGAISGPVGAAVGGVVGAVVGGLAGKAAGEAVNPTAEEAFWRENYDREPYYEHGRSFDDYGPAYRLGLSGRSRYEDPWTSVEPRLASEWESTRGNSTLNWERASAASRAAWARADEQYRRQAEQGTTARNASAGSPGAQGAVGSMQALGKDSGSNEDVIELLKDLVECCKDGEYGFRECAEQASRQDLKAFLLQRAETCRAGAQELDVLIRQCGGTPEDGGSALGAMHRGWVSIRSKLSSYDDKAVLEEAERGEDNAKTRYAKALDKPMPAHVREVVERQYRGVLRNHDQVKQLRDAQRARG